MSVTLQRVETQSGAPHPLFRDDKERDVQAPVNRLIVRATRALKDTRLLDRVEFLQNQNGLGREPHPQLQPFIADPDVLGRLDEVKGTLGELGTTNINIIARNVVFDGEEVMLSFVTATGAEANHSQDNMSGQVWVRDQALIAKAILDQGRAERNPHLLRQGRSLLTSLLHCMNSPSQLKRFDAVIKNPDTVRPELYPSIKFDLRREGDKTILDHNVDWGHNQDAWQILANIALEEYDAGTLSAVEIQHYRDFFTRIPQFLQSVDYLSYLSKGSWEEISARGRLSTLAWEWSLLPRLLKHADVFQFDEITKLSMQIMTQRGAHAIMERFPHEAALYHEPGGPSYREADAALLYIGMAQVPELLAGIAEYGCDPVDFAANPVVAAKMKEGLSPVDAMYSVMFETVDTLKDPRTGGYTRYLYDSYQASLFWLPASWHSLNRKRGLWHQKQLRDRVGTIHFAGREHLLNALNVQVGNAGYGDAIARWMHPNTQVASIAFRRAGETDDMEMRELYIQRGIRDLQDALRMITGDNDFTIAPHGEKMQIRQMKPGTAPECYVINKIGERVIIHVGPWGPLLWAAAGIRQMIAHAESLVEMARNSSNQIETYVWKWFHYLNQDKNAIIALNETDS